MPLTQKLAMFTLKLRAIFLTREQALMQLKASVLTLSAIQVI